MIKKILLFLWQLPQNIIGFIIVKVMRAKKVDFHGMPYFTCHLFWAGVSLGNYIIFDDRIFVNEIDVKHEKGHQKQSQYLGLVYLVIIGLPSIIGNIIYRIKKFDYYKQPWEAWADKLGNVRR